MVKVIETAAAKPSITSMVTVGLSSFLSLSKEMDASDGLAVFFFADGLTGAGFEAGCFGLTEAGLASGAGAGLVSGSVAGFVSGSGAGLASGSGVDFVSGFGVGCELGFAGDFAGFEGAFTWGFEAGFGGGLSELALLFSSGADLF